MISTLLAGHELRFQSLYDPNRGFGFPCDCSGEVSMDALSAPACSNYLRARSLIGREYSQPFIVAREVGGAQFDT